MKGCKTIPFLNDRYVIDVEGNVYNRNTKRKIKPIKRDNTVSVIVGCRRHAINPQKVVRDLFEEELIDIWYEKGYVQVKSSYSDVNSKYFVSKEGNVINIDNGKILKIEKSEGNTGVVRLGNRRLRISQVVMNVFNPPKNGEVRIIHKDGDRTNNNIDNLEWRGNATKRRKM